MEVIREELGLFPGAGKNSGASPFDQIKQHRADGVEFWSGRDLMELLGYDSWRRFEDAVERAQRTAENQGRNVTDLFAGAVKKSQWGRPAADVLLTRYAAYLVAMNGDPRKPEVAAAQSYFAVRTREAETGRISNATPSLPVPQSMSEALRLAADQWEKRELAEARAEEAEEIVTAVNSNRGLNLRKFHKHYFPDVSERQFFELLYSSGLLIDQRGTRTGKNGEKKNGYEHMHPTYKGKPYFMLDGPMVAGKRRESTYVRPGRPEVDLRDLLIRKGLPTADFKELEAA
ncbi:BRO family protein [Nesterenkonia lacusekhoensis]|uniref:Bro-N domain-containing protein n=1 Tax=Nesterenkonia lacusekhoensis TaxID=150832 RepID=A0ABS4T563_9MICC|nr:BRO family protein [Nesterenkonia lacusekhoensis]MBP2319608.1 hypothetical protein [Nesterenkonia lacusekhoensis]